MKMQAFVHRAARSNRAHLRVKVDEYGDDDFKAAMYRVGSPANWDKTTWCWDYPLTPAAITALKHVATERGCELIWSDDLREYAEGHLQQESYEDQVRLVIERFIRGTEALPEYPTNCPPYPMRHQQITYHWSLRTGGILLAHDPGTGKTKSASDAAGGWYQTGLIRPMQQLWRPTSRVWNKDDISPPIGCWGVQQGLLIIAPKVMLRTWVTELAQWQNMMAVEIIGERKKKIERLGMLAHAHVINYESLPLLMEVGNTYDGLILDESHRCANRSNQMLNALNLANAAVRKLALTGTPISNDLQSIFYQMLIVDGGRALGSSKEKFLSEHFTMEASENGQPRYFPKPGAVEAVSARIAKSVYFVKKAEVLDLPEKTHTPIYLEMTPEQSRYYETLKKEAITYIQDASVTTEMAATRMMKLAQVCQGFCKMDDESIKQFTDIKTNTLTDLLVGSYAGHKTVVWARFTHEIDRLCRNLEHLGVWHLRFDGTISNAHKNKAKDLWNTDPRYRVFVGQLQMGIGITLHAAECELPCCNAIFLGTDYSYTNWVQSCDRIHRIGQRWPCSYTYLLTEDGIDRRMYQALLFKERTADAVSRTGKDFYLALLQGDSNLAA